MKIRRVDLVHMTHTDIGFTDHPAATRELQKRYLDIAIDSVLAGGQMPEGARFCWTAEATVTVDDWWQAATAKRREDLLKAIDTGRLEISALAMNQTPLVDASQWRTMLHWLPEEVWNRAKPKVGIQNDVNGFPRAGAMAMLDRGAKYVWTGINGTNGAPPFRQPGAFWWKMPDGRRVFVWVGEHYARGYYYFHPDSWRRGPVPEASDTRYRPARPGDFFRADEDSLRAAHSHLLATLRDLEASGYDYPTLLLSITNEWRMDNDPPFPALDEFVAAWNRLKLSPQLRLSTASAALESLEEEVGGRIPEQEGEWTDWWANGSASDPRGVAASRKAKRLAAAAISPAWGPLDPAASRAADGIQRSLCLFDEHTWGSADSVGLPHAVDTWGQYNEKSRNAYHALAMAKLLLSQRARTAIYPRESGVYVVNTAAAPLSGWVTMPSTVLRGDYRSLVELESGARIPLEFRAGYAQFSRPSGPEQVTYENTSETVADIVPGREVRFWVSELKPHEIRRYEWSSANAEEPIANPAIRIEKDANGWPVRATWPGMKTALFEGQVGEVVGISLEGFSPRWDLTAVRQSVQRSELEMKITLAEPVGEVQVEENAHTTVFTQRVTHPRLAWGTRTLELFNAEPRAKVTVRFHRTSCEKPEWFLIGFDLPCRETPLTSCGGMPFRAWEDQLPHTCRDYYGIDGWIRYSGDAGEHLWISRDVPLVRFGTPRIGWDTVDVPEHPGRIYAYAFDNTWFTNFVADAHGAFEFQFDLAWTPDAETPAQTAARAESLVSEPQLVVQPDLKAEKVFMERLHRP